jgi:hypothetical protein
LEARSKAVVKHRNAKRPQPRRPASNETGDISIFVALWLSSFGLAVLYVLTLPHSPNQDRVARKRAISTLPNPEERRLAKHRIRIDYRENEGPFARSHRRPSHSATRFGYAASGD